MTDPFITDFDPAVGVAEELEPGLRRIVAPNASPMTFRGTNTYLLGESEVAVIDPGPEDAAHLAALKRALGRARVSHIFVTHSHVDHSPLSRRLSMQTGAPVLALGTSAFGRRPETVALAEGGALGGGEGVDAGFAPDVVLRDGEIVTGAGWRMEAIATPGHFGNHVCLAREGTVFTGDHVMSWATTMVSPPDGDIGDFMASLEKLLARPGDRRYLPGHGAPLDEPGRMLRHQLGHRRAREAQILAALDDAPGTPAVLAARIYTDVPPALLPAAARNVLAHLLDLHRRGRVASDGAPGAATAYRLA